MRKIVKYKIAIALFLSAAVALLAFLIPVQGVENANEEQKNLLEGNEFIDAEASVDTRSHFIGESFRVYVVVQYDSSTVSVEEDSFNSIYFSPLETSRTWISHRDVSENVKEYAYTAEVRGFEVIPGKSYELGTVSVAYKNLSTDLEDLFSFNTGISIHFGKYYGDSAEGVPLPESRHSIHNNASDIDLGLKISLLLSFFALGLLVFSEEKEENNEEKKIDPEVFEIANRLKGFDDISWLKKEEARTRMHQLEEDLVRLSFLVFGINPNEFWKQDTDSEWNSMTTLLSSGYKKDPPGYKDSMRAYEYAKSVFKPFLKEKKKKNRVLDKRIKGAVSKIKGR